MRIISMYRCISIIRTMRIIRTVHANRTITRITSSIVRIRRIFPINSMIGRVRCICSIKSISRISHVREVLVSYSYRVSIMLVWY